MELAWYEVGLPWAVPCLGSGELGRRACEAGSLCPVSTRPPVRCPGLSLGLGCACRLWDVQPVSPPSVPQPTQGQVLAGSFSSQARDCPARFTQTSLLFLEEICRVFSSPADWHFAHYSGGLSRGDSVFSDTPGPSSNHRFPWAASLQPVKGAGLRSGSPVARAGLSCSQHVLAWHFLAVSPSLPLSRSYARAINRNRPGHVQLEAYQTRCPVETPPVLNLFPVFCILYYEIFCRRVM